MKKKLVGMIATATLLTMALAGNVQAAEIRSVGPDGEAAVDASTIELTDDQIAQIKEGGYTAAICLHYGGNDWSTSQQKGLEDTFGELGIEIVAVTKASCNFQGITKTKGNTFQNSLCHVCSCAVHGHSEEYTSCIRIIMR